MLCRKDCDTSNNILLLLLFSHCPNLSRAAAKRLVHGMSAARVLVAVAQWLIVGKWITLYSRYKAADKLPLLVQS